MLKERDDKEHALEDLLGTSTSTMWTNDLVELEGAIEARNRAMFASRHGCIFPCVSVCKLHPSFDSKQHGVRPLQTTRCDVVVVS